MAYAVAGAYSSCARRRVWGDWGERKRGGGENWELEVATLAAGNGDGEEVGLGMVR